MSDRLSSALDLIAEVEDFPKPGVRYRDITPLLADSGGLRAVTDAFCERMPAEVDLVAGIEARGFVFAASVAYALGLGMLPLRKPGKLPSVAADVSYGLEYGTAGLELPERTVGAGDRVAVVDDVLATGGTVAAACRLIETAGAKVASVGIVLELAELEGRSTLGGRMVHALRTA